MRTIVTTPRMAISIAITTNVYGRRRASRTIHIAASFLNLSLLCYTILTRSVSEGGSRSLTLRVTVECFSALYRLLCFAGFADSFQNRIAHHAKNLFAQRSVFHGPCQHDAPTRLASVVIACSFRFVSVSPGAARVSSSSRTRIASVNALRPFSAAGRSRPSTQATHSHCQAHQDGRDLDSSRPIVGMCRASGASAARRRFFRKMQCFEHFREQRILVGEMGVESARRQLGGAHHGIHTRALVTLFPKQSARFGDDAFVGLLFVIACVTHGAARTTARWQGENGGGEHGRSRKLAVAFLMMRSQRIKPIRNRSNCRPTQRPII